MHAVFENGEEHGDALAFSVIAAQAAFIIHNQKLNPTLLLDPRITHTHACKRNRTHQGSSDLAFSMTAAQAARVLVGMGLGWPTVPSGMMRGGS